MGLLLEPLLTLLIGLVGLAMAALSRPNNGGFLNGLVRIVRWIPIFGGLTADQIVKVDRWVTNELGKATAAVVARLSSWFGAMTHYQNVVGYWSLYWPIGAFHIVRHLVERVIPHQVTARTAPLARRIDAAEAQVKATAGVAHSFPKVIRGSSKTVEITRIERVAMPHAGEWDWIHEHFHELQKTVTSVATGGVALPLPHIGALPTPWGITAKQLRRLWRFRNYILGATGAAALVATAIGGITPRCVKSGALGKVARKLCGIGPQALEDILGLIADFFILKYICEVITLLEDGLSLIQPELTAFISTAEAQFVHCGYQLPPNNTVAAPDLPTVTGLTLNPV